MRAAELLAVKAPGAGASLKFKQLDDEVFSTPALADGKLYIRTPNALYDCGKLWRSEV
ncbi:MAG: hypothetical protein HY231_13260 [Acidobacteria bacterium]|nr:hypothetical protein [Acidobacteriota bacterium]